MSVLIDRPLREHPRLVHPNERTLNQRLLTEREARSAPSPYTSSPHFTYLVLYKILLLLYNKTLNKHVTALFCLYLGNVDTSANHFRNAPVGGHTCITAGEQGEPADWGLQLCFSIGPRRRTHNNWIYYKLLNLSCGFPPHFSVRTDTIGCCGSSYGDRYIHSLVVNHRRFTAFTRG